MDLDKRHIMLHGQQEINILMPSKLNNDITITTDGKGYCFMMSNGSGYDYLSELFALGISLQKDEILFLPLKFENIKEYKNEFKELNEYHHSGLILFNYCVAQFSAKEINSAINTKIFQKELISRTCGFSKEYVEQWKIQQRTTVKEDGAFVIISTNADGFTSFAQSCANLAEYGDNVQYNEYPPHMHHDLGENTSKSLGITLYYWQSPENVMK